MINVGLFDIPDEERTANNVDMFLKKQLWRLTMMAGCHLEDIATHDFDFSPSYSKSSPEIYKAFKALKAIVETINHTLGISPKLLIKFYILQEPVWQITKELLLNHDNFREYKRNALNQFAYGWIHTQDRYCFDVVDRIDLLVYPKTEKEL